MNLLPQYEVSDNNQEMVDTILGKMYKPNLDTNSPEFQEQIRDLINLGASGPGIEVLGKGLPIAKELGKKAYQYVSPTKIGEEAEQFRRSLSPAETSAENIENLGKRVQFGKESGKEEALIPKREIYAQEGKSDVYNIGKENLPEGNIPKLAHMIEPSAEFGESQSNALQRALKEYRKNGKVESFLEKSEDIFNIPELPAKAVTKIEDALLLPTKRDSKYFSDESVTEFYASKGKLRRLHNEYSTKPVLNNYDKLQSALKEQERKLSKVAKKGLSETVEPKLEQIRANIANLDADAANFMQTLPEEMQTLEKTFRLKYATGPAKYEDAVNTIKKLSTGRASEVTDADIIRTFTRPNKNTKEIIKELGPSVGRNVIYSALNKVKPGEAREMAETLLELKRTKGFDNFISKDMEVWANNILKRSNIAEIGKKGLTIGSGIVAGSPLGIGGAIAGGLAGAAFPYAKTYLKAISNRLRK